MVAKDAMLELSGSRLRANSGLAEAFLLREDVGPSATFRDLSDTMLTKVFCWLKCRLRCNGGKIKARRM